MKIRTHYDNLKVPRTASKEEIKRAYRKLCSQHHPDKHPPENKERQNKILTIINQSYSVLSNDAERHKHDLWIAHKELCANNAKAEEEKRKEYANRYREEQNRRAAKAEKEKRERDYREARQAQWAAEMAAQKKKAEQTIKDEEDRQAYIRSEERRIKAENEKKKRKRINIGISIAVIAAIVYYSNNELNNHNSYKTTTVVKETNIQPAKLKISQLDLIRNTESTKGNTIIHDWYYDIHADQFDFEGSRNELMGSIRNYPVCQNLLINDNRKVEIIFHFLKGGKRKYMPLSLRHLCGKL